MATIAGYEVHPAAEIFPLLDSGALSELTDDVRANGLRQPLVLCGGKLLDGRNRARACEAAGVEPRFEYYDGGDPVGYVVSLNLHRRHLNESQRAMVAARIANLHDGQRADRVGTQICGAITQSSAADRLQVGTRSVQNARRVQEQGAPELAERVDAGSVPVSTAADVATLPLEEQRDLVAKGEKEILAKAKEIRQQRTEQRRNERMQKLAEISKGNLTLDGNVGPHPILYADPPWRYEHAESESRAIENQYPTMTLDEICALSVSEVSTDDAVLFLWATSPKLAEAMRVIDAWGFTYRTCLVWDKEKIGMGYYARQQHELLLVCTKGQPPAPAPSARPPSVVRVARGKHSAKPLEFHRIIEAMYPELPRLEMFCRDPQEGWTAWGNQSDTDS